MTLKERIKERVLWIPHNIIAHPLMAILPKKYGNKIHNITIPKLSRLKENER